MHNSFRIVRYSLFVNKSVIYPLELKEIVMKLKSKSKLLYAGFALALIVPAPSNAQEFECAKHIEAAQDAIDAANDRMAFWREWTVTAACPSTWSATAAR